MSQLGAGGVTTFPGATSGAAYPQYFGIFFGVVNNNADPNNSNRCLLQVPQLFGTAVTTWAVSLTPLQTPPAVGTVITAMFIGGDVDYPVYLVTDPKILVESVAGNIQPVGTTGAAGTSNKLAAADHVHTLANALESTDGNIQAVASTSAAGVSAKAARGDHVHSGLPAGSAGFLEIDSSPAFGGDTQASVQLESAGYAGQSTINLDAQQVDLSSLMTVNSGTGQVNMSTASEVIIGNGGILSLLSANGYPLAQDPFSGPSWGSGERNYINSIVLVVNQLIASLSSLKIL